MIQFLINDRSHRQKNIQNKIPLAEKQGTSHKQTKHEPKLTSAENHIVIDLPSNFSQQNQQS